MKEIIPWILIALWMCFGIYGMILLYSDMMICGAWGLIILIGACIGVNAINDTDSKKEEEK